MDYKEQIDSELDLKFHKKLLKKSIVMSNLQFTFLPLLFLNKHYFLVNIQLNHPLYIKQGISNKQTSRKKTRKWE